MSRPFLHTAFESLAEGSPLAWALASIVAFAAMAAVAGCQVGPPAADELALDRLPAEQVVDAPHAPGAGNPLADLASVDGRLGGRVAEVLPAGGYTYFRLADGTWAVVMGRGPTVGQTIDARVFAEKRGFRSRRLDRTFAALRFVSLSGG